MGKIRVLVLSHMYPRVDNPTAGIFIHQQVRYLERAGCSVVVVAPIPYVPAFLPRKEQFEGYRKTPQQAEIDGVRVLYPRYLRPPGAPFHAPSSYTMYWGIRRAVGRFIPEFRPQILHAHTATPDGYVGLLLKQRYGLPLVVSLRGSDVNIYPHRDRWTFRLASRVIERADKVTAVSYALRSAAERIARPQQDIAVVYTGCDLDAFAFNEAARASVRAMLGIASESLVLIFIGYLRRTKGLLELVDAFRLLYQGYPDLHLLIVGAGDDCEPVVARMAEVGVGDRVHFAGARPHHEIPAWLSAADVLILPSWHEGLPNVVVEAMACERPVVATRVGGIPEVVVDGESGILVERNDAVALANAIASLANDPARRVAMGAMGRRIVERGFTWEKNAEQTIQIYREVLDGRLP
jgi:teichuronic acid biosynthesis glycosyltransferase TuaC